MFPCTSDAFNLWYASTGTGTDISDIRTFFTSIPLLV